MNYILNLWDTHYVLSSSFHCWETEAHRSNYSKFWRVSGIKDKHILFFISISTVKLPLKSLCLSRVPFCSCERVYTLIKIHSFLNIANLEGENGIFLQQKLGKISDLPKLDTLCPYKDSYMNVPGSFICDSQKLGIT